MVSKEAAETSEAMREWQMPQEEPSLVFWSERGRGISERRTLTHSEAIGSYRDDLG